MEKKTRVGLIVEDLSVPWHVQHILEESRHSSVYTVAAVVVFGKASRHKNEPRFDIKNNVDPF